MSFTTVAPRFDRLYRSKLFVPGSRPDFFPKAIAGPADVVCLDLEDAVAPADKPQARQNVKAALNEMDFGDKYVTVRINGLDTPWCFRDVIALVAETGDRLDAIMIPKVGVAADVYAIDMLITQCEQEQGKSKRIGLEVIIESAMGIENVNEICAGSGRLETVHFGAADFAASTRMRTTNIGGHNEDYRMLGDAREDGRARESVLADLWHYQFARMVAAARAHGLTPIDGPFGDYKDPEGFRAQALRTAILGCEGKWAIHPSQVELANDIFTPPAAEVEKARAILAAMDEAQKTGHGAATYKGQLIDAASIRQAHAVLNKIKAIGAS